MRKTLLLISILAVAGTATAFTASMEPLKTSASPDSPALFQVQVENNGSEPQRYKMTHEFSKSGWVYYDSYKTLQSGETSVFNVSVTPGEEAIQNRYSIRLTVTEQSTGTAKSFSDILSVQRSNLVNVKDIQYSDTRLDPGETVDVSITVQNLASRILSGYNLTSSMQDEERQVQGDPLAPGALKTYSFSYQMPEDAFPGNRTIQTQVNYQDSTQNFSKVVEVNEIRNVTRETTEINRGLYVSGSVSRSNYGNDNVSIEEDMTFPTYVKPILSFSEVPVSSSENGSNTVYRWNNTLQPGESITYSYSINYWMPLVLAAAIMAGLFLLKNLTGNVRIKKKTERDGDKVKVSLEIENRSSNAKNVIEVKDFVPNIVNLNEDFKMAKPEIRRSTDGAELYWELEDFKPGEKRVINYEVEEKVEVEGGVDLPQAEIVEDGKTVSKSS